MKSNKVVSIRILRKAAKFAAVAVMVCFAANARADWTYDRQARTITDGDWVLAVNASGQNLTVTSVRVASSGTELNLSTPVMDEDLNEFAIVAIGQQAFRNRSLTSVTLPNTLKAIYEQAFAGCSNLKTVTPFLPAEVMIIGANAFNGCPIETELVLSNPALAAVPTSAFQYTRISSADLSQSGITAIGDYAFRNNQSLTSVTLPETLARIGAQVFASCPNLSTVTVESQTPPALGSSAIQTTSKLEAIYVPATSLSTYKSASGWSGLATLITTTAEGGKLNPWSAGDGVTAYTNGLGGLVIGGAGATADYSKKNPAPWAAFATSITSVIIGDDVTDIGSRFFKGCTKLNTVTGGAGLVSFGENAFYQCMSLETIKIDNEEFDLDSLSDSIVYQTAIAADGTLYLIPNIEIKGYQVKLYGKQSLSDGDWTDLGPVSDWKKMSDYGDYRFFKTVLEK